jgi:hypothetical protein
MKEFWLTILRKVKRPQTQCLSSKGDFWVCSEETLEWSKILFGERKGDGKDWTSKKDQGTG